MPSKLKITKELQIGNKRIVVYDGYYLNQNTDPKECENVVCYDKDGGVLWKINGVQGSKDWSDFDTFCGIKLADDGNLIVDTWYCHVFNVDIDTGKATYIKSLK